MWDDRLKFLAILLLCVITQLTDRTNSQSYDLDDDEWEDLIDENAEAENPAEVIQRMYSNFPVDTSRPEITAKHLALACNDTSPERVAPPNNEKPTKISAAFAVDRLVKFSDVDEYINVMGMMLLHWNVTTCTYDSLDEYLTKTSGSTRLFVASNKDIWLPKYVFTSSSVDIFMQGEQFGDDTVAKISYSKDQPLVISFYNLRRGFFTSDCQLDLTKFPFDSQMCVFRFALQRAQNLVQFGKVDVICPKKDFTEWNFDECSQHGFMDILSGNNVSYVDIYMTLSRKPWYYVVNLALPSTCLSLLEMATFLLPSHHPDRPVLGVTLLLALTVAMSDVLNDVPKTSQRVLLSDYILYLTWFATGVTFYHMIACCMAHIDNGDKYRKRTLEVGICKGATFMRAMDIFVFFIALAVFLSLHGYAATVIKS